MKFFVAFAALLVAANAADFCYDDTVEACTHDKGGEFHFFFFPKLTSILETIFSFVTFGMF